MTTQARIAAAVLLASFGLFLIANSGRFLSSGRSVPAATPAQAAETVKAKAGQRGLQVRTVSCHRSDYTDQGGATEFDCAASFYPLATNSISYPTIWCVTDYSGPAAMIAADEACAKLPNSRKS